MTEFNPADAGTLELIQDIRARNQAEPVAIARAEIDRQTAVEGIADPGMILGNEAAALIDRMWWLERHFRLAQRLGGEAYRMTYQQDTRLWTPLMLGTCINDMQIAESVYDTRLTEGYRFGASNATQIRTNPGSLQIDHLAVDASGAEQWVDWWIVGISRTRTGDVAEAKVEESDRIGSSDNDEAYNLPIGLTMQARAALGRGQILSKLLK